LSELPASIVLHWNESHPEPPLRANPPPDRITIRWIPPPLDAIDVKYLAEDHCLAWDRHAEEVRHETDGAVHVAEFVCKHPSKY
jgi:hypothetical protein